MIELSEADYGEIIDLHKQQFRPKREDLLELDRIERFRSKEFDSGDVAELFHENTKLDPMARRSSQQTSASLNTAELLYFQAQAGRHDYDERPLVELPDPPALSAAVGEVMLGRRSHRSFADESMSLADFSAVLRYGVGPSGTMDVEVTEEASIERQRRTYPSPGSLNPIELYVCVLDVEGLEDGLYFYSPGEHGLRELDVGHDDFAGAVDESLAGENNLSIETAGVHLVFAATFWRAKVKYGPRGYRYALQESGHMAQNVLLAAEAAGLGGVPLAAFDDAGTNDLLGLDGVNRAAVYSLLLGPKE